ncbi:hypothetical protein F4604DRAFT_1686166 [Suillus subluteus]|nr:hypothetical protein F4604DRAFT_1686166 [Suillus subluteus]
MTGLLSQGIPGMPVTQSVVPYNGFLMKVLTYMTCMVYLTQKVYRHWACPDSTCWHLRSLDGWQTSHILRYTISHLGRLSYIMTKVILVVPDPGRKKTRSQVQQQTYTDWVLTSLPHQEANYLLGIVDLEGLIFTATHQQSLGKEVPEGHKMVHINEVLLMWHTIDISPKSCLQACYMNFKTFAEIIHMRLDKLQEAMKKFAAVWGGWDLTKNHRLIPDLGGRQRGPNVVPPSRFFKGSGLEGVLPVWPGTLECRAASHDYNTIDLLDSIAKDITKSHRPTTQIITPGTKPGPHLNNLAVVKHEASSSRHLIKYPWNKKMPSSTEKHGEYRLLMQLYVLEWDQVGQWRCLMVNQALFCIFIHPGSSTLACPDSHVLDPSLREDGWSLKELGL